MKARRAGRNLEAMKVLSVVLLAVLAGALAGCRDGATTPGPVQTLPFTLNFAPGNRFQYNTYVLDANYPDVLPTGTLSSWHVLRTGVQYQGMSKVTVIVDSVSASVDTTGQDTLYLAESASGDLSIYGFLSRIARQRFGRILPPHWDLVASFSAGSTGIWTVGVTDSLSQEVVYGNLVGGADYFSATVDGLTEDFPTYRVDLTGPTLSYSLWFSNTPNAVVQLLEQPDIGVNGQLREIAAITTAHQ